MKKLFIVTGEHSGDVHASFVAKELKQLIPDIQIEAVGGKNLKEQGVKLFSDNSNMGVIGLGAVTKIVGHFKLGKNIVKYLKDSFKPDAVLLIDYGGFNLRLAKELKKNNIRVFYYISPQIWGSRKGRLNNIREFTDKMMVIFPFEEKLHKSANVNVEFVGHPLVSQLNRNFSKEEFISENKLDPSKKIIGLFPGSRKMEISYLFPIFLQAAKIIQKAMPKAQFCLAQSSNIDDELIFKYLQKYNKNKEIDLKIVKNQNQAALACSDVVMLASGTVTLEAAIYKTPMIVSYKGAAFVYLIYLMLRYIKWLSLPNIISEKTVVKEFLQYEAKPDLIAEEVLSLLTDTEKRNSMIKDFELIQEKLGDKVAYKEVARILKEFLND